MSNPGDGFRTRTVEVSAGRVHVHEAGTGEPLLFVHGFGVNSELWRQTATALAASHRCILPELPFGSHTDALDPGADLSPPGAADLLAELIAALGLDGATVIANDSGGAITQIMLSRDPSRVGRVVLTNCDCLEVFPPSPFKQLAKVMSLPVLGSVIVQGMRFEFNRRSPLAYGALTKRRLSSELLDSWVRPQIEDRAVRRDAAKFFGGMDPQHTLAAAERLGELEMPVLLAWAEEDRYFTIELAERLAARFADAELVRIPDALTFVSLDQPVLLAEAVADFVARRPLQQRAA